MLALVALSQALRWWCVRTLGHRWNTLVIVVPQAPLIRRGPYRWLHHPNYVAVVVEGIALPLVHTAWLTAACFTLANALLLTVRIRVENAALGYLTYDADLLIVGGGPGNGFFRRSHVFAQISAAEPASGFGQLDGEAAEVAFVK